MDVDDDVQTRLITDNGDESEVGGHQTGSCGSDGFVCESLSVDDMLVKWVGEFGLAQLAHFVAVSFAWAFEGLHTFVMVFADHQPAWQCRKPALLSSSIKNVLAMAGLAFFYPKCTSAHNLEIAAINEILAGIRA